jgi:polyisoprenoid-binding protein YceI
MKPSNIRIVEFSKSRVIAACLGIIMLAMIAPFASAESDSWSLDSGTSSSRFFQGSRTDPGSVNTGVARVTGNVSINPNDLNNSVIDLSIYPSDENWENALDGETVLPVGFVPDATEHTLLTFKSKEIVRATDGKLQVTGDLTLTRVERNITLIPNEAYAGPAYGDPVIHTETREITFLFPSVNAEPLSGGLQPAAQKTQLELEVSGAALVVHEDFPELLTAIRGTNWPSVVNNETCTMPAGVGGEDYSGAQCSGTLIAATSNTNCRMPATVGEDYSGALCSPPSGDQTTIVLDLKLVRSNSEPSMETLSVVGQ